MRLYRQHLHIFTQTVWHTQLANSPT